jgi:hypothetical protein
MTEGRHYWEIELTSGHQIMIGAARPGLDPDTHHHRGSGAICTWGFNGGLWGNGQANAYPQGAFAAGDRIGVLLDLDAGWMRFFRNGKRCGPGYTEGVTGPLVRAVALVYQGDRVTVLPGAVAPEGAGGADEVRLPEAQRR